MDVMGSVWRGEYQRPMESGDGLEDEIPMTEAFILDEISFFEQKMRWNKNTKESRKMECWVCEEETNNYYSHQWRIKGGRIANIKCEHCYNEYMDKNDKSL